MKYIINNSYIRYKNIDVSETTEGRAFWCNFWKRVKDNEHICKSKVLMNRIHKCRIVDISTETQYIEMYGRMRNKQIEEYNENTKK